MSSKKQITIIDVANEAGVSMGTVDRVIHNRGDVSQKSSKRVRDAIQKLGYKPNLHTTIQSVKRKYLIAVVIPSYYPGDYWECVHVAVQKVMSEYFNQNITIEIINFNQFDRSSFEEACVNTELKKPSAVLIAPIFRDSSIEFTKRFNKLCVPIVYIDSYIDKMDYLAYFGIPQFESGYLLAHMLFHYCDNAPQRVVNFVFDSSNSQPNHSAHNRLNGVKAYIKEHNIDCIIDTCAIKHNNTVDNFRVIDNYFSNHPDVSKLMVLSSRVYMIAEWLEIRCVTNKQLFGFDALSRNIDSVSRGYVDTIIVENLSQSIQDALLATIRFLLFNQRPQLNNNYSSMNILNRCNIDFYKR